MFILFAEYPKNNKKINQHGLNLLSIAQVLLSSAFGGP